MKIERPKRIKLVFEPAEEGWEILNDARQLEIAKAIAHPVRYAIYRELDKGPMRQFELAERLRRVMGRKLPATLIKHHLNYHVRAGLVGIESLRGTQGRAKMVYKAADIRTHLRMREKPFVPQHRAVVRSPEELKESLRNIFGGSVSKK